MTSEEFRNNPMFLRNQFKGDGVFEIPKIEKEEIELENIELIGYDKLSENETDNASIRFLKMYRDEFGFEIDDYIEQLSIDLYKNEFAKKVFNI